jgi:hypothetical protein
VTAETVSVQGLAAGLSSATGLPIFVVLRGVTTTPSGDALTARQLAENSSPLLRDHGLTMSSGQALIIRGLGPPLRCIEDLASRTVNVTH